MSRFYRLLLTDMKVQYRNKLYTIGVIFSAILAVGVSQLVKPDNFFLTVPPLILIVVGATALLYVAGMIQFEKEEGTLSATIISPVTLTEYLWSKVITLTLLASLETSIMIGGAYTILNLSKELALPNIAIILLGTISVSILYTLVGIILIVRFKKITEFLLPMAAVIAVLQLPFIHFWRVVTSDFFLLIPTSAPTMIIQGAGESLGHSQWVYALSYTTISIIVFELWARSAFNFYIVEGDS